MLLCSPRSITITEQNPETVDQYLVQILSYPAGDALIGNNYPSGGGTTVCPIGTDGFLGNAVEAAQLTDNQQINIKVTAKKDGNFGTPVIVAGGPYTVVILPDEPENITVQL